MTSLRFLFDEHVSKPASDALAERGVGVLHALDIGLAGAPDEAVLSRAAADGRIVVTRNYADFARLIEAYRREQRAFPGVLFLPISLAAGDVGGHVHAVEAWLDAHSGEESPLANGFGWLAAP